MWRDAQVHPPLAKLDARVATIAKSAEVGREGIDEVFHLCKNRFAAREALRQRACGCEIIHGLPIVRCYPIKSHTVHKHLAANRAGERLRCKVVTSKKSKKEKCLWTITNLFHANSYLPVPHRNFDRGGVAGWWGHLRKSHNKPPRGKLE